MTQPFLNRCIFNAASGGTGDFVDASAVTGYMEPAIAGAINGQELHYAAQSASLHDWEVGKGIWTAGTSTLSRASVLYNSLGTGINEGGGGAKISFNAAPQVLISALAEDIGTGGGSPGLTLVVPGLNDNYYVAVTGSDVTGNGSVGNPWLTPQHAADFVCQHLDMHGGDVSITLAHGTYTQGAGVSLYLPGFAGEGFGFVHLVGDGASPSSVIINGNAGNPLIFVEGGGWIIFGCTLGTAGSGANNSYLIWHFYPGSFGIDTCRLGSVSLAQLYCDIAGANMGVNTTEVIGTAPSWVRADFGGFIACDHGTLTLTVDPACTQGLVHAKRFGSVNFGPMPITGTNSGLAIFADTCGRVTHTTTPVGSGNFCGGDAVIGAGNAPSIIVAPSFIGDSGTGGTIGYVPAPGAGDAAAGKFLKANATWAIPSGSGGGMAIGGAIGSGTGGSKVLYDDGSTTLQEAANFNISSGNPNVTAGNSYMYAGTSVMSAQTALANFYDGGASNFTATGTNNLATGPGALQVMTSGNNNACIGAGAGGAITSGASNLLLGNVAGGGITTGTRNVGIGRNTLGADTTALGNLAIGNQAMQSGTGATSCTCMGTNLGNYTSPSNLIAIGTSCMGGNATGSDCIAIGDSCLANYTSGTNLIAIGSSNLNAATTAFDCIALGHSSLTAATADSYHIAIGFNALQHCNIGTTSNGNVCIGYLAGRNLSTGDANTFVGAGVFNTSGCGINVTTGSNNTIIGGHGGTSTMSNCIILSDGASNNRMDYNLTNAGCWSMATGQVVGAATGGYQGAGTINVSTNIYKNGASYTNPAWVFDHYYDGKVDAVGPHVPPAHYDGLLDIEKAETFVREHHELPRMKMLDGKQGLFDGGDLVLAALEEAYLYIFQLHRRIEALERKMRN